MREGGEPKDIEESNFGSAYREREYNIQKKVTDTPQFLFILLTCQLRT